MGLGPFVPSVAKPSRVNGWHMLPTSVHDGAELARTTWRPFVRRGIAKRESTSRVIDRGLFY